MAIGTEIVVPVTYKTKVDDSAIDSTFSRQTDQYPPFQKMQTEGETQDFQLLNETINDNADSFKMNTALLKEFGNIMPDIIHTFRQMNSVVAQTASSLPAIGKVKSSEEQRKNQIESYKRRNFFGLLDTGNNTLASVSHGNISGGGISVINGTANTVNNLAEIEKLKGLEGLSKGTMFLGGGLLAAGALLKGGKVLADSYKDALPTITATGKAFGTTDSDEAFNLYRTVNDRNLGTGLDIESFNSVVQDLRKQGVANNYTSPTSQAIAASEIAQTTSRWAYATGGDANQYAQLAGIMSRYGGSKNVSEDFNYLVSAGKASGLNDSQIPEFLSGIQKVMEEGIARGFSRSSTEVADTLLMFSKMSGGNAFWQGEQGARLLNQANAGIAGATSLSKTEDILVYQAIKSAYAGKVNKNGKEISKTEATLGDTFVNGGDYINTMQLIERGINPDNFDDIMNTLNSSYGDNTAAKIEALRNMTGLNYTGAARLYNLNTGDKDYETKLKNILEAPENKNDDTRWKESINKIYESLQQGGKPLFNVELKGMEAVSRGVDRISNLLYRDKSKFGDITYEKNNKYLTSEYYDNKAKAEEKLAELPAYKRSWFEDRVKSPDFNPGINGEGWLSVLKELEAFDPRKDKYNSPNVRSVSPDEMPYQYNDNLKVTMAYKQGYKETNGYNGTYNDDIFEMQSDLIHSVLKGKDDDYVNDFFTLLEEERENVKKLYDNGGVDRADKENEQKQLVELINKIVNKLNEGFIINKSN